jgi:hypothetical protein
LGKKKIERFLNIKNTDLDKWIKLDCRDKKSKAMIMYYYGYNEKFIYQKLNLSKKKLKAWIKEIYCYKRPKPNSIKNNRVQDGKSKWVDKIIFNKKEDKEEE